MLITSVGFEKENIESRIIDGSDYGVALDYFMMVVIIVISFVSI